MQSDRSRISLDSGHPVGSDPDSWVRYPSIPNENELLMPEIVLEIVSAHLISESAWYAVLLRMLIMFLKFVSLALSAYCSLGFNQLSVVHVKD